MAVSRQNVAVAGCNLAVNEDGKGNPILILHRSIGLVGWGDFEIAVAGSAKAIVPDLPGYGHSERPDWAREPRDLAIMINGLAHELGLEGATVAGLGMGGFVAAELATMRPAWMQRLVLVSAAGVKPAEGEITDQMLMAHADYLKAGFADKARHAGLFGDELHADARDVLEFSRIMTARISWSPYMFSRRLPPLLPLINVPTTVVWGTDDAVIPAVVAGQYCDAIPGAQQVNLTGGHLLEFEAPDELAKVIVDA